MSKFTVVVQGDADTIDDLLEQLPEWQLPEGTTIVSVGVVLTVPEGILPYTVGEDGRVAIHREPEQPPDE
jgi:hypothetical protein